MLLDACADAGSQVGAYDLRILHWRANYEPATCAVVAGLIARAHAVAADGAPMTADARVTGAREYLDGARMRKVTELPPFGSPRSKARGWRAGPAAGRCGTARRMSPEREMARAVTDPALPSPSGPGSCATRYQQYRLETGDDLRIVKKVIDSLG